MSGRAGYLFLSWVLYAGGIKWRKLFVCCCVFLGKTLNPSGLPFGRRETRVLVWNIEARGLRAGRVCTASPRKALGGEAQPLQLPPPGGESW